MGLASRWATEEDSVKKAIKQDSKPKKVSEHKETTVETVSTNKQKKKPILESQWASVEEEPVTKSPASTSSVKASLKKDAHIIDGDHDDNSTIATKSSSKHRNRNKSHRKNETQSETSNSLASRITANSDNGGSDKEKHKPQHRKVQEAEEEEEVPSPEEVIEDEEDEELNPDFSKLSIGAQSLASRLGMPGAPAKQIPKAPSSFGRKANVEGKKHQEPNKNKPQPQTQTHNHDHNQSSKNKPKKHDTPLRSKSDARNEPKQQHQQPKAEPKPKINFDAMFDDFAKNKDFDWGDDNGEDDWDFAKYT